MRDYESMILARQDEIYDGMLEQDDVITVSIWDHAKQGYVLQKELTGEAARQYMDENGIW